MPVFVKIANVPAVPRFTGAWLVNGTLLVVKLQVTGLVNAIPPALAAAVLTVAIYEVLVLSAVATGVNVAIVSVTSMTTVPGTLFPDASVSVNVSCCPANCD